VPPPLHDVLYQKHVAEVGADGAPAAERAISGVVQVEVQVHAAVEVAGVGLEERGGAVDCWPTFECHTARA
jgi:hypothetical protein